MNYKFIIILICVMSVIRGTSLYYNKENNIISSFEEKINLLKNNDKLGDIHLYDNMSWFELCENLTSGYYYREKSEITDYKNEECNLSIEFPDGYKIEQVDWGDINQEVGWGHTIYYDYDMKKIWMFWVVGFKGRTLLITYCDFTE